MKNKIIGTENLGEDDLKELKKRLGVVECLRALEQFDDNGSGDYTSEKYKNDDPELSDDEIRKMFGL